MCQLDADLTDIACKRLSERRRGSSRRAPQKTSSIPELERLGLDAEAVRRVLDPDRVHVGLLVPTIGW
jgi:hypothetical protein